MRRTLTLVLTVLTVFGAVTAATAMKITAQPEPNVTVGYKFTGDEAEKAGFAQGVITVTPQNGAQTDGYYLLYYADDEEILKDYDAIAALKVTGSAVSCTVGDGVMLPPEATRVVALYSQTRTQIGQPTVAMAIGTAYTIPESKRLTLGEADAVFGMVADVHMDYQSYSRGAYEKWTAVLNFFAKENASAILVAGDMTGNDNLDADYQTYLNLIAASDFPAERIYEGIGNHGNLPTTWDTFLQYTSGEGEVRPSEDTAYFSVLLENEGKRDNLFVFLAQELDASGNTAVIDNFSSEQLDWLEALLAQYGQTETNIFLAIHAPFLNFGAGERHDGGYGGCIKLTDDFPQNMRLKALLETYRDVIVLSGHTHLSLYDGENYSDEYNSFARTVHLGSTCFPCAYGEGAVYTRGTDGWQSVTEEYGSEASLVRVYGEYLSFTGYNMSTGKIIPAACLLLPVHAYGGEGKPQVTVRTPEEAFEGNGTADDPYLIRNGDDFLALTNGFNAATAESKMYGEGLYFLQTADIDMRTVALYGGTTANGNMKCYFAGTYDGGGHTITVEINETGQRSVFPYLYGTLCNVVIRGSITASQTAQPVRTSHGNLLNCVFDLDLSAPLANGVLYSNYGFVYNVVTRGTLTGDEVHAVAANSTSTDYVNVFHARTLADGTAVSDTAGTPLSDVRAVAAAFNDRAGSGYRRAVKLVGEETLLLLAEDGVSFVQPQSEEVFAESSTDETAPPVSDVESENSPAKTPSGIGRFVLFGTLALAALLCVGGAVLYRKRKNPSDR